MPSSVPASVPLMPSCASSTLPFSPRPAQIARSGSRKLAEIRQRGKLIEGGDLKRHGGVFIRRAKCGETLHFRPLPSLAPNVSCSPAFWAARERRNNSDK